MLAVLTDDSDSLSKFSQFCEKKLCSENLAFWQAVQEYKSSDAEKRKTKAGVLISEYIVNGAPLQINLDCGVVKKILAAKDVTTPNLFSEAENYVFSLMELDVYPNFLKEQERLESEKALQPGKKKHRLLSSTGSKPKTKPKSKSAEYLSPSSASSRSSSSSKFTSQQLKLNHLSPEARNMFLAQQHKIQKEKQATKKRKERKKQKEANSVS